MVDIQSFDELRGGLSAEAMIRDVPSQAMQLCEAIDAGKSSAIELERIILADPGLTAGVLRAANAAAFAGYSKGATTVRQSIMVLGERSVRSLAVAVWVQSLIQNASAAHFDGKKFADHSMYVGLLARYLFARVRKQAEVPTAITPDEVFAAAVLHDLGLGVLASVYPDTFDATSITAQGNGSGLNEAFCARFENHPSDLAVDLLIAWKLPSLFTHIVGGWHHPWEHKEETLALECVYYANYLAEVTGENFWAWESDPVNDLPSESIVLLESDEDERVVAQVIEGQMRAFRTAA